MSSAIFRSNQNACPITSLHRDTSVSGCSPQNKITLTGFDIHYGTSQSFQEIICIFAKTNSVTDSTLLFTLQITVCGNEQLTSVQLPASQSSYLIQKSEQKIIPFENSWFIMDPIDSDDLCFQPLSFSLATGHDCLGQSNQNDFFLDLYANTITLTAKNPMNPIILCLVATTRGLVSSYQQISVEVCGNESISYQRLDPFENFFTFSRTETSSFTSIDLSTLGFNFESSRSNCPIYFKFVQTLDGQVPSEFNDTIISVNNKTGQISVDTFYPLDIEGHISAYSYNYHQKLNSDVFHITVCGYESIRNGTIYMASVRNTGIQVGQQYQDYFQNLMNNTNCSSHNYEMGFISGDLSSLFDEHDVILSDGKIVFNTDMEIPEHSCVEQALDVIILTCYLISTKTLGLIDLQVFVELKYTMTLLAQNNENEITFSLQATTIGCENGNIYARDSKFRKILKVKPYVAKDIGYLLTLMLEEVALPSTIFDQPDDMPWDETTQIDMINAKVDKQQLIYYTEQFALNRPKIQLPLNQIKLALFEGVAVNVTGIAADGKICTSILPTLASYYNEQIDVVYMLDDIIIETVDYAEQQKIVLEQQLKEDFEKKISDLSKVEKKKRMKLQSITTYYNYEMQLLVKIRFSKQVIPLQGNEINKLPDVLNLFVRSAQDGSKFQGIFQPPSNTRQLCQGVDCAYSKQEFSTIQSNVDEAFKSLQFKWEYQNINQNFIEIKLDFQYPFNVSFNNFGNDILFLQIFQNDVIRDAENNLTIDISSSDKIFANDLSPRPAKPKTEVILKDAVNKVSVFLLVMQASGLLKNMLLSKALQDIWGVLNAQIIIIHLILLRCQMTNPGNMLTFNSILTELTQKDMYPTDQIYGEVFHFTEKPSAIKHFEILGYKGANFIVMTGSVLINILLPLFSFIAKQMILKITYRFKKNKQMRLLGCMVSKINFATTILPLYIMGYLEIVFCAFNSLEGLTSKDFDGSNKSDLIAAIFLFLSLIIMIFLPLMLVYVAIKNKGKLDDPEIQEKYGFLFTGMKVDCQWSSLFNLFFILRRTLFALILIEMHKFNGLQLIAVVILSSIKVLYLAHFRPYREESMNKKESFNEICCFLVTYFLMWLSILPDFDESEVDVIETVGWFYIAAVSFNIIVNFVIVGYSALLNFPSTLRLLKHKFRIQRYNQFKKRFFREKLEEFEKFSQSQKHQFLLNESKKIEIRDKFQAELNDLKMQQFKQKQWMFQGKIDDQEFQEFLEETFQNEVQQLENQFYGVERRENEELGILDVRLTISNQLLTGRFVHNDANLLKCKPPYRELKFLQIQQNFKENTPILFPEDIQKMNEMVEESMTKCLLKFIKTQQYWFVDIRKDGNCGPRVVSQRKFGNQSSHKLVRRQTCQKLKDDLKIQFKDKLESEDYKQKLKSIEEMNKDGKWFTDKELQACSTLYGFPIIVFSILNKMMFFDTLIAPSGQSNNYECPLYVLQHNNHFTALVHREQVNLLKFYRKKGSKVEIFSPKQFKKDNQEIEQPYDSVIEKKSNFTSEKKQKAKSRPKLEQIPAKTKKKLDIRYQIKPEEPKVIKKSVAKSKDSMTVNNNLFLQTNDSQQVSKDIEGQKQEIHLTEQEEKTEFNRFLEGLKGERELPVFLQVLAEPDPVCKNYYEPRSSDDEKTSEELKQLKEQKVLMDRRRLQGFI